MSAEEQVKRHLAEYGRILREGPELKFDGRNFGGGEHIALELLYAVGHGLVQAEVLEPFRPHLRGCRQCQENSRRYVDSPMVGQDARGVVVGGLEYEPVTETTKRRPTQWRGAAARVRRAVPLIVAGSFVAALIRASASVMHLIARVFTR